MNTTTTTTTITVTTKNWPNFSSKRLTKILKEAGGLTETSKRRTLSFASVIIKIHQTSAFGKERVGVGTGVGEGV